MDNEIIFWENANMLDLTNPGTNILYEINF